MKKYHNVRSAWMYAYASKLYQDRGGKYSGSKTNNSLNNWIASEWQTKSGQNALQSGERYLPKKIIEKLTDTEYKETSEKKRKDLKKGLKNSPQPDKIRKKVSRLMDRLNLG